MNYLLQELLLLRPPGLLLLLGLQRLGDLGDGDEAVRLAEHQRVAGLEQLHPRDARGAMMLEQHTELTCALLGLLFPFMMCNCTRVTRYMSYPIYRTMYTCELYFHETRHCFLLSQLFD